MKKTIIVNLSKINKFLDMIDDGITCNDNFGLGGCCPLPKLKGKKCSKYCDTHNRNENSKHCRESILNYFQDKL